MKRRSVVSISSAATRPIRYTGIYTRMYGIIFQLTKQMLLQFPELEGHAVARELHVVQGRCKTKKPTVTHTHAHARTLVEKKSALT